MANDSTSFYYWYRRYKVRAVDMTGFQDSMVETARGLSEGLLGASVLKGFEVSIDSGFQVEVSAGIAAAPSGYLEVVNEVTTLDLSSATGTLPCRSLIVCTPDPTDENFITSPTSPFVSVPLNSVQKSVVRFLTGTPAQNPEYPSRGPNDVVICGVRIPSNSTGLDVSMFDYEVRDSLGLNSKIGQNQVRFDDRLRPYRSSAKVLGVKPSQTVGSGPLGFSYPGRLTPSLYPVSAGSFTPSDSLVDFSSGMISGGDGSTPDFSPHIPTLNHSVICAVTLTLQDTLNFNFGVEGGFDQCLNAIRNQQFGNGPGSLPALDGNFPIAWVIISSQGGLISDIQVYDGRPFLGSGSAAAKYKKETPTGTVNGSNTAFTLSAVPSDPDSLLFFVDQNLLTDEDYQLSGNQVTITNPDVVPAAGQTLYAAYLIYGAVSNNPSGGGVTTGKFKQETPSGVVDGVNDTFVLSSLPVDLNSLIFWIDQNPLEESDYNIVGSVVTIINPEMIPVPGQTIYAYYLISGSVGGGGGGGGSGGLTVYGSRSSPTVVTAATGVLVSADQRQLRFVKSTGGAVNILANPQVEAGFVVGQELILRGAPAASTDYIVLQDGNGLDLNGPVNLTDNESLELIWDGSVWFEGVGRRL